MAEQGFAAAQVAVVASVADVATGSVYRHFPSKSSLFAEMLRSVCERELTVVRTIAAEPGRRALDRIGDCVASFVDRALRGEGLAYAVIVEPMAPDVDRVRLEARAALAATFADLIEEGIAAGELAEQDAQLRGAAIVGAFLEGVVASLASRIETPLDRAAIAREIAQFCQAGVRLSSPGRHPMNTAMSPRSLPANLVGDLNDVDAFTGDKIAAAAIAAHAPWSRPHAQRLGRQVWSPAILAVVRDAHRYLPELRTHDRLGHRIDIVDYYPAYHHLMATGFGHGVHALSWTADRPGSHLARAVLSYLWNQIDGATACPTGMAYAAIPTLREAPRLAPYAARVSRHGYDPAYAPIETKTAATIGYAMTEKQGGSDLRANVTVARPAGPRGPGEAYLLNGHKWFCSAPMSDGFFTVARTEAGPCCFFAPRWRPDGTPNGIVIQRLKDKLGNRANASSEIEYHDAYAVLVGEEGHGVRTILTSSDYTRLDFAIGSPDSSGPRCPRRCTMPTSAARSGRGCPSCPSRRRCWPTSPWSGRVLPTSRSGWPARSIATTMSASVCSAGS